MNPEDIDGIVSRIGAEDDAPTMEELQAVHTELSAMSDSLKESIKDHDGTFAELRAKKADHDTVTEALAAVTPALEALQAEADQIKASVGVDPDDDDDEDDDADDDAKETEGAKAEPVAASANRREAIARVKEHATRKAVQVVSEPDDQDRLREVNTTYTLNGRDMETVDPREIGQAFADTKRKWGGSKTSVLSIKTELHPDRTLKGDAAENERKLLDLFGANPMVPVTAAGGCCSIPEPIYDQPLIGSLARPIRDAFDVVGASRGAVTNYPPVCIPDEGADVWTCAQDEAVDPDDPDTWKTCVAIECDEFETTLVEPIFKCLTVGTWEQRFAPEQWEARVFGVDKLAARLAEARLFNWLAEASTNVWADTGIATGSTYANFIKTQIRLATWIRQDQRLADTQMVSVGSDMIYGAILEDSVTRRTNDADEIEILKAHVDEVLRGFGVTYVGSPDVAAFDGDFSYDGDFPAYPENLPTVMVPAGSVKVLDGGEKNLGMDVVGMNEARQNIVGAFSEFWEGALVRNCRVAFANVAVEDCTTIACIGA